jgi:heme/copper-type cytochrome/quinol oxidase subunit 2
MVNSILIAIIVIGVVLVVLALLVWRRQKEEKPERISSTQKKAFFVQFVIGIGIALMAAIFMFDGDILGENTAGISTVLGIIGIGLIATSNVHLLPLRRK